MKDGVDYFLYGAGRALGFMRMAAYALDEPYSSQKVAEYHAYTGISAAPRLPILEGLNPKYRKPNLRKSTE